MRHALSLRPRIALTCTALLVGLLELPAPARAGVPFFDWGHEVVELPRNGADESTVVDANDFGIVIGTIITGGVATPVTWSPLSCPPTCDPVEFGVIPFPSPPGFTESFFDLSNVGSGGFVYEAAARISNETGVASPFVRRFFVNNPVAIVDIELPLPEGYDSGAALGVNRHGDAVGFALDTQTGATLGVFWEQATFNSYSAVPLDGTYQAVGISDDGPVLASGDDSTTLLFLNPETDLTDVITLGTGSTGLVPVGLGQVDPASGAGQTRVIGGIVEPGESVEAIVFADPIADPDSFLTVNAGQPSQATGVDSLGFVTVLQGEPGLGDAVAGFSLIGEDLSTRPECAHDAGFDLGFCPLQGFAPGTSLVLREPASVNERGQIAVTATDPDTGDRVAVTVVPITPVITLTPADSISFGTVEVGDESTLAVTISNVGGDVLIVTDVALLQTDRPFSVAPPELPATVAPTESTTFDWTFAPTAEGFFFADVQILSNDPTHPDKSISAIGTSVAPTPEPDITVTPPFHDFGRVPLGGVGTVDLTIDNDGTEVLNIDAIALGSASSEDLVITAAPATPVSIPAGGRQTVTVQFTANAIGDAVGTLEIASDDPDEGLVIVELSARGVEPVDPPGVTLPVVNQFNVDLVEVEVTGEIGNEYSLAVSDGVTTVVASGTFSDVAEQVAVDLTGLLDGPITAAAVQINPDGDVSEPGLDTSLKDTVPPAVSVTLPDVNRANHTAVRVLIAGEAGADYVLDIDDGSGQVRVGGTIPESGQVEHVRDLRVLDDGTLNARVTATDAAGNSGFATDTALKDTEAPLRPTVGMETVNAANVGNALLFLAGAGQGDVSANISVASDLEVIFVDGTTSPDGDFSTEVDVSELPDGELELRGTLTDDAGNESEPGTNTTTKDTVIPEPPAVDLQGAINIDSGGIAGVDLLGEPGASVSGSVSDGTFFARFEGLLDEGGQLSTDLDVTALRDGSLTAVATQTDAAGNESGPGSDEEVKDTVAPNVTIVSPAGPAVFRVGEDIEVRAEVSDENGIASTTLRGCQAFGDDFDCDLREVFMSSPDAAGVSTGMIRFAEELNPVILEVTTLDTNENGKIDRLSIVVGRPDIAVSPGELLLPDTLVGSISSRTVSISNGGTAPLAVTSVGLADTGLDLFVDGVPELPATLQPGESFDVMVSFRPTAEGSAVTTLDIASDDPDTPVATVMLVGDAVRPQIAVDTFDLGELLVGESSSHGLEVRNEGTGDLQVSGVTATSEQSDVEVVGAVPALVAPGESTLYQIVVVPTLVGPITVTVAIDNDTPDSEVVTVVLSGEVAGQPEIAVSPADGVAFPDTSLDDSAAETVTVTNDGTTVLVVDTFEIREPGEDFSFIDLVETPLVLLPGESFEIVVSFTPLEVGTSRGELAIDSDDPDEPETIVGLEGTGVSGEGAAPKRGSRACQSSLVAGSSPLDDPALPLLAFVALLRRLVRWRRR